MLDIRSCLHKMMTYIGIIIGCICLVAIALIGYFLYKRILNQENTIEEVVSRQLSLESVLTRPPKQQELESLLTTKEDDECSECDIVPVKIDDTETTEN